MGTPEQPGVRESVRDGTGERAGVCWAGQVGRGCLGVMAHPRGGNRLADEIRALRTECVGVLVSLLTPDEAMGLGLAEEQARCEAEGIEFESFPISDRGVPPQHELTYRFLEHLLAELWSGRNVVVHCRVGQGRSGLVAASLLVMAGVPEEEAVDQVATARGLPIPDTQEQRTWISALVHLWKARHTF